MTYGKKTLIKRYLKINEKKTSHRKIEMHTKALPSFCFLRNETKEIITMKPN